MKKKNKVTIKKSKKNSKEEAMLGVALAACVWLSLSFLFHTFVMTKWLVHSNVLGAPKTMSAVLFVLLAVYAWINAKADWIKYLLLILATVIAVCYLVWLFGMTSAGNGLENVNNSLIL